MSFLARSILYRRATSEDDGALQTAALRNPMDGWVRISMQRSPSYFAGENLMGRSVPVVASDQAAEGLPVGMYDCTFLPVWVNGDATTAGYLGGLRVHPGYRRRLRILKDGFASIPILLEEEVAETPVWFTSIASDNQVARRILEAGLDGMPDYRPIGDVETLVMSTRQARPGNMLSQATADDIRGLVDLHGQQAATYQFSGRLTEEWLHNLCGVKGLRIEDFWLLKDRGCITACVALWDQRAFKQTVIHGYRFPLNFLRGPHNLFASARGRPSLPPAGAHLESLFLSFFARTPAVSDATAVAMIREVLWRVSQRGGRLGIIGLSTENPILPELRSRLRGVVYRTCIEQVTLPGTQPFTADRRPPQPEIAVL